ncbi:Endoribonuclease L-PSP/chorismate mutase-like protein, partial [Lasiosphaeria hispida]
FDPVAWEVVGDAVKDQTRQALRNISAVLEEAGSKLQNVVKVNIFLTIMGDFAAMNEAYDEFFT